MEPIGFVRKAERVFSVAGTDVQVFESQVYGVNEFSIKDAAEVHERAMGWLHKVHGTSEESFRTSLMDCLPPVETKNPHHVLVTACGTGDDLPYLVAKFPDSYFWIQDFAEEMLAAAITRHKNLIESLSHPPVFFVGDAESLPFRDDSFDLVYHFGGINLYVDVAGGISEMHRVAQRLGLVFFGDEGMAPWVRETELGKVLSTNNPLYLTEAPLHHLPPDVQDFSLEYRFNNCFYIVKYVKSEWPSVDLDIPHEGKRGGSLRTRFYGNLEGVSPELRNSFYRKAEALGKSRVEMLEDALRQSIEAKE
jgi:SAM-dependent methyltransferase